jgi:hypothetical protein
MNGESQVNGASVNGQGQTQYAQTRLNKIRVYKHRGMFTAGDIQSVQICQPLSTANTEEDGGHRALTVANTTF